MPFHVRPLILLSMLGYLFALVSQLQVGTEAGAASQPVTCAVRVETLPVAMPSVIQSTNSAKPGILADPPDRRRGAGVCPWEKATGKTELPLIDRPGSPPGRVLPPMPGFTAPTFASPLLPGEVSLRTAAPDVPRHVGNVPP
jgi:hypothetical protein